MKKIIPPIILVLLLVVPVFLFAEESTTEYITITIGVDTYQKEKPKDYEEALQTIEDLVKLIDVYNNEYTDVEYKTKDMVGDVKTTIDNLANDVDTVQKDVQSIDDRFNTLVGKDDLVEVSEDVLTETLKELRNEYNGSQFLLTANYYLLSSSEHLVSIGGGTYFTSNFFWNVNLGANIIVETNTTFHPVIGVGIGFYF